MKVAVVLNGNIRTLDACIPSLKSFLCGLDADIFVSTYDLRYGYHPCVSQSTGFISDEMLSEDQVREMLQPISPSAVVVNKHQPYFESKSLEIGRGFHRHEYGSLMQFFKMEDSLSLISQRELSLGFRYDALIKTRCDLTYLTEAPVSMISEDTILIDSGNVFPNDCVLLGKRTPMERIIRRMASICRTTEDRNDNATKEIPHGMLSLAAQKENLNFIETDIMRGVIRWNGEVPYPPLPSPLRRQT